MGLLLAAGWLIFIVWYNNWLTADKGISALRIGRILAAAVDIFLWGTIISAKWDAVFDLKSIMEDFGSFLIFLLFIVLAIFVLLVIIALNYKDCQSH